ncbi:CU044_5270 family protein [[Actinomadura] parvosata]|uniref:CU044_5270 family protein n=1 Tax=[Actinomadura] parvosata TaxID=1955412 RepID=UPI00164865EE
MDEFDLLARCFPTTPPSPEVAERAHARLTAVMSEPSGRLRRRQALWPWTVAATAGIITAVIALIASLTPAPRPAARQATGTVPPPSLTPADANKTLLRIADSVAQRANQPNRTGAYWRLQQLSDTLMRVKAGKRTFNILAGYRYNLWLPIDQRNSAQVLRYEYVRPATPADEQIWRAAGSPLMVHRIGCLIKNCPLMRVTNAPWDCVYERPPKRPFSNLTFEDLAALPADLDELRKAMREFWQADNGQSFGFFVSRLLNAPISPAVRATALRLLAELPTTEVGEQIIDPLGRPGLTVSFNKSEEFSNRFGTDDAVRQRYITILDPRTGILLTDFASIATESADGLARDTYVQYNALEEMGWTNNKSEPQDCRQKTQPRPS